MVLMNALMHGTSHPERVIQYTDKGYSVLCKVDMSVQSGMGKYKKDLDHFCLNIIMRLM